MPDQNLPKYSTRGGIDRAVAWLLAFCSFWVSASVLGGTFTNPIISDGADPWILFNNGQYYFTDTTGTGVYVREATRLAGTNGIGSVASVKVFSPPAPYNQDVWAPEIHVIQGVTYIYYAADDGTNADHRVFVAQQVGQSDTFTYKGKVYDPTTDCWAIDPTVLEAANGSLYLIWSGWPGTQNVIQNLYIAPMSNPWTISGPRVLIATPQLSWESWIEEGPEVLQHNGMVFIVYSANESWTDNECLGMLVNTNGDYLNPSSWTKMSQPVFQSVSNATGAVYGPGGSSFTTSLDGTQNWLFYHAATNEGAGWNRSIRMQSFTWNANGYPNFGQPIPAGVAQADPSGDDYTPALLQSITLQTNRQVLVTAQAPLPLLTNQWTVQYSSDLKNWSALTNVPGMQFSASALDSPAVSNRFYRVKSSR
jgi:GH43 family beta-xylosidase